MVRFFVEPPDISAKTIRLKPEDIEHIRVLRLRPDERFVLCDGKGTDYICCLGDRFDGSTAEIITQQKSAGEPTVKCTVYMAYSKGERSEYAVQKSVELGAHEIILFESERCIAVPNNIPKKTERLQRIALEAAKQNNRGIIPKVSSGGRFKAVINEAVRCSDLSLLFYEYEENQHIKSVLEKHFPPLREQEEFQTRSVSMITGPEGGFEPDEVAFAQSKDVLIVSLGSRILRSETAPVVALATVMYHTNNL